MISKAKQVDFLVAGVQKGGTTALHALLSRSRELDLGTTKEVHFFDDESVDWNDPDYGRYHAFFEFSDGMKCGEATPIYIYWPGSLERIQRYRRSMQLILLFRDPVERAFSHWRMERARGFDDASFGWAIRDGRSRVSGNTEPPGCHRVFSYVERGFYGAQLQRALSLFSSDQVLCLKSDDLLHRTQSALAKVCEFLGIRPIEFADDNIMHNISLDPGSICEEDEAYLRNIYQKDQVVFSSLTGIEFFGRR